MSVHICGHLRPSAAHISNFAGNWTALAGLERWHRAPTIVAEWNHRRRTARTNSPRPGTTSRAAISAPGLTAHPAVRGGMGERGEFGGRLHKLRVSHRDLTGGNILLTADAGNPDAVHHALVDLNRLEFRRVGWLGGLANLMGPGFRGADVK